MVRTHFGQHGDDCYGCKLRNVSIGLPSDMPTRSDVASKKAYEKTRVRDIEAYKRLRVEGAVKSTQGAARLEQTARTKFELETGQVMPVASMSRRLEEAQSEVKERMAVHAKETA